MWAPATSADAALADEVNRVWNENDVGALDGIYAADLQLFTSWGLPTSDNLDAVRATVADVPNTYERVSPVTVTTDAVTGLPPLPDGWRYLHWVVLIHGDRFDSVSAVDGAGLIHVSYVDDYQEASWHLEHGFPAFSRLLETPTPINGR